MSNSDIDTITHESLKTGISELSDRDPDLAQVVGTLGQPPLWSREPGFGTLIHIILEQQVSLASAQSAFDKLIAAANDELTPGTFLAFTDGELKEFGFSRQKARYGRLLSESLANGTLSLQDLHHMSDADAREALMDVKGIGPWTANIYLLMALRRQDVWPSGDLAVKKAIGEIKGMDDTPDTAKADEIALQWKPWRSVSTRILWHHYLNGS